MPVSHVPVHPADEVELTALVQHGQPGPLEIGHRDLGVGRSALEQAMLGQPPVHGRRLRRSLGARLAEVLTVRNTRRDPEHVDVHVEQVGGGHAHAGL